MKHLAIIGFLLANLMVSQSALSSNKVYTWTDAQGVVHYGERPPKDTKATLIRTRTGHSDPAPANSEQNIADSAEKKPEATAEKPDLKDPQRCANAKKNMDTLNGVARIKIKDEKGELRYLTEKEKADKRKESQKAMDESC